jgi:hypothetical protein
MSQYIRRFSVPLAVALSLTVAACGGDKSADTPLAQDTTLNRDLELANADSAAMPALTDTVAPEAEPAAVAPAPRPAAPRPAATRPAPKPAAPKSAAPRPTTTASGNTVTSGSGSERSVGTIPAGTQLALTSNAKVCTNTHKVGDTFTATVSESVTGSNGAVIPAGATANVTVTQLKRSENANDQIIVGLRVNSVTTGGRTYALDGSVSDVAVTRVRNSSTGNDAKKVLGGAILGAIAGQVIGKDTKGTVIGGAAGAAAGTAAAAATANYEGCVDEGGRILVTLDAPATVQS